MRTEGLLACDLGASKLALRVCDAAGCRDELILLPRTERGLVSIERISTRLAALRHEHGRPFCAAAMACAPTIDTHGVVARWPNRPDWEGLSLLPCLEAALQTGIHVEDDGAAATIAEAHAASASSVLYLGLGSGVGGGILVDGVLQRRRDGRTIELGHIVVDFDGHHCPCGNRGCLQTIASGLALREQCHINADDSGYGAVGALLARHEPAAEIAVATVVRALSAGVLTLQEMFAFELVILGGGLLEEVPEIVSRCASYLRQTNLTDRALLEVRRAHYGLASSLYGAELLARRAAGLQRPAQSLPYAAISVSE